MKHPLPFYDGCYWFDNSTLSTWLTCSREYEYETIHNRVATFNVPALNYGKAMHLALAALSMSCGNQYTNANLGVLNKLLADHFERFPQPPDDHRTLGLAQETLARYIRTYEIEPWTILEANGFPLIERLMWVPFRMYNGIQVNVYGLMDLAVQDTSRNIWVVDRKTTYQLGDMFGYDMQATAQMPGYAWLFERCFGKRPLGYVVDAIRSNAPSETAKKSQSALETWWQAQFKRLPFFVSDARLAEWEKNTHRHLDMLLWQHEQGYTTMNTVNCVRKYGRCQFYDVCTLPGEERLVALNSNLFQDNDWTRKTLEEKLNKQEKK